MRGALAELVELLSDIDTQTDRIADSYWSCHAPFVDRHFVTTDFQWGWPDGELAELIGDAPQSPFESDVSALRTREFWNLMYGWKILYADQLVPIVAARVRCRDVLDMLDTAIGNAGR